MHPFVLEHTWHLPVIESPKIDYSIEYSKEFLRNIMNQHCKLVHTHKLSYCLKGIKNYLSTLRFSEIGIAMIIVKTLYAFFASSQTLINEINIIYTEVLVHFCNHLLLCIQCKLQKHLHHLKLIKNLKCNYIFWQYQCSRLLKLPWYILIHM